MDKEFCGYDNDEKTSVEPGDNFYYLSPKENRTVASYVAKNRHVISVGDIRRPVPRFQDGSICLKVRNVVTSIFLQTLHSYINTLI